MSFFPFLLILFQHSAISRISLSLNVAFFGKLCLSFFFVRRKPFVCLSVFFFSDLSHFLEWDTIYEFTFERKSRSRAESRSFRNKISLIHSSGHSRFNEFNFGKQNAAQHVGTIFNENKISEFKKNPLTSFKEISLNLPRIF